MSGKCLLFLHYLVEVTWQEECFQVFSFILFTALENKPENLQKEKPNQ